MDFTIGIFLRNLATTSNFVEFQARQNLHVFLDTDNRVPKNECDVTKVTYIMYSCDTCCMSIEMIEMDGRDSAKCQKSKLRDMIGIN